MAGTLASLYVSITGDGSKLRATVADVKKSLADVDRTKVQPKITLPDVKPQLDAMQARLATLGKTQVKLNVDATTARAEVQTISKQLEALQASRHSIPVDLRGTIDAQIVQMERELAAAEKRQHTIPLKLERITGQIDAVKGQLATIAAANVPVKLTGLALVRAQIARLSAQKAEVDVHVKATGDKGAPFDPMKLLKIPALLGAVNLAGSALSSLGAGAISLTAAIAPAAGALAAFPVLLGGVAQGSGVVKAAVTGVADAMKVQTQMQALVASGTKITAQQQQAYENKMKGFGPVILTFVKQLNQTKDGLKDVRMSIQRTLLPQLGASMQQLSGRYMPVLNKQLTGTATVLAGVAKGFTRMLLTGEATKNVTAILSGNNRIIGLLGKAATNLAPVLLRVWVAALPMAIRFADWLVKITGGFERMTRGVSGANGLSRFFKLAGDTASQLGKILGNLTVGLFNVFKGGYTQGKGFLDLFQTLTARFAKWTSTLAGKNAIADFFARAQPVLNETGRLITAVVVAFAKMSTQGGLAPIIAQVRTQLLPALATISQSVDSKLLPSLVTLATNAAKFFNVMAGHSGQLTQTVAILNKFANVAFYLLQHVPGATSALGAFFAVMAVKQAFGWIDNIIGFTSILPKLTGLIGGLGKAFNVVKIAGGLLLGPVGLIAAGVIALGVGVYEAYKHFAPFRDVVNKVGDALKGAFLTALTTVGKAVGAVSSVVTNLFSGNFAAAGQQISTFVSTVRKGIQGLLPKILPALKLAGVALVSWIVKNAPPMLVALGSFIGKAVAWIVGTGLPRLVAGVGKLGAALLGWVVKKGPGLLAEFGTVIAKVVAWIATKGVPLLLKGIVGLAAVIVLGFVKVAQGVVKGFAAEFGKTDIGKFLLPKIKAGWAAVTGFFASAGKGITTALAKAWTAVSGFFSGAGKVTLVGSVNGVWKSVAGGVASAWKGITTALARAWSAIGAWFKTAGNVILAPIKAVWAAIGPGVTAAFKVIGAVIGKAVHLWWAVIKVELAIILTVFKLAWDAYKFVVKAVFGFIKDKIIVPIWTGIKAVFAAAQTALGKAWTAFWGVVKTAASAAWGFVKDKIITPVWIGIKTVFSAAQTALTKAWNALWTAVKTVAKTEWTFVKDKIITPVWTAIKTVFSAAQTALSKAWTTFWTAVKTAASTAWTFVKDKIITPIWTAIKTAWTAAQTWISGKWTTFWTAVKTAASTAWTFVKKNILDATWALIKNAWTTTQTWIAGKWTSFWTTIKNAASTAWTYVKKNILDATWTLIKNAWTTAQTFVTKKWDGFWTTIKNTGKTAINWVKDTLNTVWGQITDRVGKFVSSAGTAMDRIKGVLAAPVNWVIKNVFSKIAKAYNSVAGLVGAAKIPNFAGGGSVPDPNAANKGRNSAQSTGGGLANGGPVRRDAGGPIVGRGGPREDNIMGVDWKKGVQTAWVSAGEFVVNAKQYMKNKELVHAINSGQLEDAARRKAGAGVSLAGVAGEQGRSRPKGLLGLAAGGMVYLAGGGSGLNIDAAKAFARAHVGDRYRMGSVGPHSFDCSGFMAAITNVLRGQSPYRRLGSTANFPWSGFRRGVGEFTIGSTSNYGHSGVGHMAGTLAGLNVESSGGKGVHIGSGARGYYDRGFNEVYHLGRSGSVWDKVSGAVKGAYGAVVQAVLHPKQMFAKAIGGLLNGIEGKIPNGSTPFGKLIAQVPRHLIEVLKAKLPSIINDTGGDTGGGGGGGAKPTGTMLSNAQTIAEVGAPMGRRAQTIAIATALVESGLKNVHYGDRDSLGLFQQRAAWGPASARLNPAVSAGMFLHGGRGGQRGLDDIPGWRSMSMGTAAQRVQVSAYPTRYAAQINRAQSILDQVTRRVHPGLQTGGLVKGGRGGVTARIGEGRFDELVTPLPKNWQASANRQQGGDVAELVALIKAGQVGGNTVTMTAYNPLPEKTTLSTNKGLQRAAGLNMV